MILDFNFVLQICCISFSGCKKLRSFYPEARIMSFKCRKELLNQAHYFLCKICLFPTHKDKQNMSRYSFPLFFLCILPKEYKTIPVTASRSKETYQPQSSLNSRLLVSCAVSCKINFKSTFVE